MKRRATKLIIRLEDIPCIRLRDLRLFRLRKGRLQRDLYSIFWCLDRAYKKTYMQRACRGRTWERLKEGRIGLD